MNVLRPLLARDADCGRLRDQLTRGLVRLSFDLRLVARGIGIAALELGVLAIEVSLRPVQRLPGVLDPLTSRPDRLSGRFLRAHRIQTKARRPFPYALLACLDLSFSGVKGRLPIVSEALALVGQGIALVGHSFPLIGRATALIRDRALLFGHGSSLRLAAACRRRLSASRLRAIRACGA